MNIKLATLSSLVVASLTLTACGSKDKTDTDMPADDTQTEQVEVIEQVDREATQPLVDGEQPEIMQAEEALTDEQLSAMLGQNQENLAEVAPDTLDSTGNDQIKDVIADSVAVSEEPENTSAQDPEAVAQLSEASTKAEADAAAEALAMADEVQ